MTISFAKTDRHQELINLVGGLADKFSETADYYDRSGKFPFEHINQLKKIGYHLYSLPSAHGGKEISLYEFLLMQERLAEGNASTALAIGWHLGVLIELGENTRLKKEVYEYLVNKVRQGSLINRANTEPQTGSPTRGGRPQTSASKKGNHWIITGKKTYTTMAPALDLFIVTAAIEGSQTVGEFLIPKETLGVSIEESWHTISMRGTGSHTLVLDKVSVPDYSLIDTVAGRKTMVNGWWLFIPACYLGIANAARNYAVQFAKTHSPNSIKGTIQDLPNVQRLIGSLELDLIQARHFLYSVADKWDLTPISERKHIAHELSAVKHAVTNTAISVVDQAMRVVGAQSIFEENPLQRYYRDVRAGLHNPPMDDATITLLASHAFASSKDRQVIRGV